MISTLYCENIGVVWPRTPIEILYRLNKKFLRKMKESFRIIQVGSIIGCVLFLIGAILAYFYTETSQGMLPVIVQPFREVSPFFFFISVFLGVLFIGVTVLYEVKGNRDAY